jgi:tRNA 2-thiouridine synthesizing protein A
MVEPTILDARGLRCPLPVLKARKAMKDLPVGATLRILATDPGAIKDFEAFCKTTGHRLLSAIQDGDVLTFDIQKAY